MKTIGICSDHAGFELKEYVRGWRSKVGLIRTLVHTLPKVAIMLTSLIRWHLLLKPVNAIRASLFAEVVKVSV